MLERQPQEKSPEFLKRARSLLEKLKTDHRPGGTMKLTPLLETIATSFQAHQGHRVARFIFADGEIFHPCFTTSFIELIIAFNLY